MDRPCSIDRNDKCATVIVREAEWKRDLRRNRSRWKNTVNVDLKLLADEDVRLELLSVDRGQRGTFVSEALNLRFL